MAGAMFQRLTRAELIETSIRRHEGVLLQNGALSVDTGEFTGRSPKDKFIVVSGKEKHLHSTLPRMTAENYDRLFLKVTSYLRERGAFVFDGAVNRHARYEVPVTFYTEYAWHNLFVQNLFKALSHQDLRHAPIRVYCAPSVKADPSLDGTRSETFIILNLMKNEILIGGTEYAGEMKKSVFSLMHAWLQERDVLPMHCSATVDPSGDVALFFGLSGTGKTTLSSDPNRQLIGDDEHGWAEDGVFNLENGCYAKCIGLSAIQEPEIFGAIQFGTVLENVGYGMDRNPRYDDASKTENTRAAYPLKAITTSLPSGRAGHPKAIVFLSADATGVLPAIARLSPEDAMRHYLLGYTSKLAGTERGVEHPESVFSACFAAPFLIHEPMVYAGMLAKRIKEHNTPVYLVNTGWVRGGYGSASRIPLHVTRKLVNMALALELETCNYVRDDELYLDVPSEILGVDAEYLKPEQGFRSPEEYQSRRKALVESFRAVSSPLVMS